MIIGLISHAEQVVGRLSMRERKMQLFKRALVAIGSVLLCAAPSQAVVTVYSASDIANSSDPRPNSNAMAASFDSAAGGLGPLAIITFETAPVGIFNNLVVATGVSMDGLDISSNDQQILNASIGFPADGYWGYNTTPAGFKFVQNSAGSVTFTFTTPIQSFGAYISGTQLNFNEIQFNDGVSQVIPVPNPSSANGGITFVGFTDPGQSISAVTINSIGDILGIDDVRYGTVPEPTSALAELVLSGLLWRGRRR